MHNSMGNFKPKSISTISFPEGQEQQIGFPLWSLVLLTIGSVAMLAHFALQNSIFNFFKLPWPCVTDLLTSKSVKYRPLRNKKLFSDRVVLIRAGLRILCIETASTLSKYFTHFRATFK